MINNLDSEPTVVLKDATMTADNLWESYEKGYPGKWYHVEPLRRFLAQPPLNPVWYLFGTYPNWDTAWQAMEEDLLGLLRESSVTASSYGPQMRFQILRRDDYRCQLCGRTAEDGVKLEVDHKVARANGGSDEPDNLWTLCYECNRGKGVEML